MKNKIVQGALLSVVVSMFAIDEGVTSPSCFEAYAENGAVPGDKNCPWDAATAHFDMGNYYCGGSSGLKYYMPAYCGAVQGDQCGEDGNFVSPPNGVGSYVGNPINVATGHKIERVVDYIDQDYEGVNFPLMFERIYNSSAILGDGSFGPRWRGTYDRTIENHGAEKIKLVRHSGGMYDFNKVNGEWISLSMRTTKVIELFDSNGQRSGWRVVFKDLTEERYDANGRLQSIANRQSARVGA
jgi:hypothetical protein